MEKGDDGENTSLEAPGALAHRLQRRTACNTSPPALSKMAEISTDTPESVKNMVDSPFRITFLGNSSSFSQTYA